MNFFKRLFYKTIYIVGILGILAGCAPQPVSRNLNIPLNTVKVVDLQKYLGQWYEIYRLPNWFEDLDCNTVTAQYSMREDGDIKVLNTCHKEGKIKEAIGVAQVVDKTNSSKLKVSFFRPFYGDYWIIDLAADYSWALIGEESGKYFWILARQPQLNPNLENELLERAKKLGYQTERLIKPKNDLIIHSQ
jgi:apolipoprotein D and lipocalin family protein